MKKLIISLVLIATMALVGCATTGSGGKRDNSQDLRKSPCASLTTELMDVAV